MSKKNADGVPETFKSFIQKSKFDRERRRHVQNVQLDDTLDHYIWNGIDTIQYKVILGDCEKLASIASKKEYSLVIADIPHGYNIQNIEYDNGPYTYQDFSKVVMGFTEVTTSPFWIF
jgi:ribosomal protein L2